MTRFFLALGLLLAATPFAPAAAQQDPSQAVFADDVLPVVRIEVDPDHLAFLLDPANSQSDLDFAARFTFDSPQLTATVDSVGFRLRGNTSRVSQKKSFKISFNSFTQGGEFQGLEKLNLNGEHNDPTIMRAKLAWDAFRAMGVPASRANHVRLFINDAYFGLYLNVEHVDEVFLRRHFGRADGNLYKCLWPADLTFLGPDGHDYYPGDDRRPYDLKLRDSDAEGYDDLAAFITVVNHAPTVEFPATIASAFDVNGFLRAQAATVLSGSWDSYWFLKNNFYLYFDPGTDRFHYIPFDYDNAFGIWWDGILSGVDWAHRDVYKWGHPHEPRPLARRLLEVPEFRERYTLFVLKGLEGPFAPATMRSAIDRLKALTQAAAEADAFRTLDYGFTVEDYHDSFNLALGDRSGNQAHVTHGLRPFVDARHTSASAQVEAHAIAPVLSDVLVHPQAPRSTDALAVRARIDALGAVTAHVLVEVPGAETRAYPMTAADATWFEVAVPPLGNVAQATLQLVARDDAGRERRSEPVTVQVDGEAPALYINELMARNDFSLTDTFGEFDDWIELYAAGDEPVRLQGFYLSDDATQPLQWALPDTTVAAGGYLILWLDGQPEQGAVHGPFRLDADGEFVGLFAADGTPIDGVTFGPLEANAVFGREGDAGAFWNVLPYATPGAANPVVGTAVSEHAALPHGVSLNAYPNPFSDVLTLRLEGTQPSDPVHTVAVFDLLGRRIARLSAESDGVMRWRGSGVAPGVYIVRARSRSGIVHTALVTRR